MKFVLALLVGVIGCVVKDLNESSKTKNIEQLKGESILIELGTVVLMLAILLC